MKIKNISNAFGILVIEFLSNRVASREANQWLCSEFYHFLRNAISKYQHKECIKEMVWSSLSHNLTWSLGHHRWRATTPFHLVPSSAALVELAKSIPVHSLIFSSHLFFCLPLLLFFPFTVPYRSVFAEQKDLETWPNHLSFRFLTVVRSSLYYPMAAWIFLRTSSMVTWSLYEIFNTIR